MSGKAKGKKAAADDNDEGDKEDIWRCICGAVSQETDEVGGAMVCCDSCDAWQHNVCMGLDEGDEPKTYFCEQCKPENHAELLAAIQRGEKPWEPRVEQRDRKKKGKGKKKGGRQSRTSAIRAEMSEDGSSPKPQQSSPATLPQESSTLQTTEAGSEAALPDQEVHHDPHTVHHGYMLTAPQQQQQPPPAAQEEQIKYEPIAESEDQGKRKRSRSSHANGDAALKRRKQSGGSVAEDRRGSGQGPVEQIKDLPTDRQKVAQHLQKVMADGIQKAVKDGSYRIPDVDNRATVSERHAIAVEYAMHVHHGERTPAYTTQFRSISANIKINPALLNRLLNGSLTADELSVMSSEDMASEERQLEDAKIKEQADKQAMLIHEEGPRIRKTHKGEEIIDDDRSQRRVEEAYPEPPVPRRESAIQSDEVMREGSPSVELPEDVGAVQPLHIDTSTTHRSSTSRPSATGFDITNIWSSVGSPDEHHRRASQTLPRQNSEAISNQPHGIVHDPDIDMLLRDDDNDGYQPFSPAENAAAPEICWSGQITMPHIASFSASARHVAGGDVGQKVPWSDLLVPTPLSVNGRISMAVGNEYISSMKFTPTIDVAVLALIPNPSDRDEFAKLYDYFHKRQRWGSIGQHDHALLKDLYIIPLEAGAGPFPPFYDELQYKIIEMPRPENMLLLAVVSRTGSPPGSNIQTPSRPEVSDPASHSGQSQQPPTHPPHPPPQYSPVAGHGAAPPNNLPPSYGSPYALLHGQPPPQPQQQPPSFPAYPPFGSPPLSMAQQILGPYIDAPVLGGNMPEELLRNLRAVLDKNPAAGSDFQVLSQELYAPRAS
ncbi:Transcription factor bye1 [Coniosporium tulheliwenetii]|uniref:Transcription factor bye1 n=1 Tax=Coniosporium tulheliwenetii TaxID=3383036 RepID=A0ACC2YY66_9PEZI|nr:Transcription factor bye1 [Cladosporium sp. JES 115]